MSPLNTDSKTPTPKELERRVCRLEKSKVEQGVYDVEKRNFREDLIEAKTIALAANRKSGEPHMHCPKAEKVEAMEKTLSGLGKIKFPVIISLLLVVASAVAGVVRTQSSVEAMDKTVQEMKVEREKKDEEVRKEKLNRRDRMAEQRIMMTEAVKAAFAEAQPTKADIQPRTNPRRRRELSGSSGNR